MKKLQTPKVRIKNFNYKYVFNYLFIILLTSFIFVSILIALPLTERFSSQVTYDLKDKKDLYWAKEYTLELDIYKDTEKKKKLDDVKSIIYKRLSKLGVEKVTMNSFSQNEKEYIEVLVQSSLAQEYVDELVRNPFLISVVKRNPEINFEDPENPYAIYLEENYIPTDFTRSSFRNVYITQLKNSANEYSYFALFKTWPWGSEWNTFLNDSMGQEVGISIDGFVTPVQVPTTQPLVFAAPLSTTSKEEAELISILYNSGVVPSSYTVVDQQVLPIENIESDYIKLIEGVIIAVIVIYAYLLLIDRTDKKILMTSSLATILTVSLWISYLKISNIPVDIFLLAIEVITMIAILRITTENSESKIIVNVLLALIASLIAILGVGFAKIFASDLFVLIILGLCSQQIAQYYISNVKRILKI